MLATFVCVGGDEGPAELATGVAGGEADGGGGGSAGAADELLTSSLMALVSRCGRSSGLSGGWVGTTASEWKLESDGP